MAREIVLDTETTGLDPASGDRLVEIGAIELINHVPTGKSYQTYLNPERMMSAGASEVSGITDDLLKDKPLFSSVADDFLRFLGPSQLVIHNAKFDLGFINHELFLCGRSALDNPVIDTVILARRKFPGAPASLDALCRRFSIDLSERQKHGALLDARLLASVYLELIGGRQPGLKLLGEGETGSVEGAAPRAVPKRPSPLPARVSEDDRAAHARFVAQELGEKALWRQMRGRGGD